MDDYLAQTLQRRLKLPPDPTCYILARWILQSLHFIEVMVVDLFLNRSEGALNVGEVDDPAKLWIERSLNVDLDLEGVTM